MNSNFTRRRFLKTVVVSAGAVGAGGLIGCGSSSSSQHGDSNTSTSGSTDVNPITDESLFVVNKPTSINTFPQSVASGDPRHNSIILWSRIESSSAADLGAALQVSTSETDFTEETIVARAQLSAEADHDHCLKVKITDLDAGTTYYYRFIYDGTPTVVGRFKTAPALDSTSNVKFAVASCQDFTGRYYHTYTKLLEEGNEDIDFVVHLGDYIYETDGDPSFQASSPDRLVEKIGGGKGFDDESGAIEILDSDGNVSHHAANSVDNYRQLYRTFRSDETLRTVHERFAFICIWDDHEFSDDSWQENGTYFDGTQLENSIARKKNAEQAFFEYQPLDVDPSSGLRESAGQFNVEQADLFPSQIFRSFRFGQTMSLTMSDFRTYRPDHAIEEDRYPGEMALTQTDLARTLYVLPNATGAAFKAQVDGALVANGFEETDLDSLIKNTTAGVVNPNLSAGHISVLGQVVTGSVSANLLTGFAYVDIDSVADTDFLTFLWSLNGALGALGRGITDTFAANTGQPTLKEYLIFVTTTGYALAGLDNQTELASGRTAAHDKAVESVTGDLAIAFINGTLANVYNALPDALMQTLAPTLVTSLAAQVAPISAPLAAGLTGNMDAIQTQLVDGDGDFLSTFSPTLTAVITGANGIQELLTTTITNLLVLAGTDAGVAAATGSAMTATLDADTLTKTKDVNPAIASIVLKITAFSIAATSPADSAALTSASDDIISGATDDIKVDAVITIVNLLAQYDGDDATPILPGLANDRFLPDSFDTDGNFDATEYGALTTGSWGFGGFGLPVVALGKTSLMGNNGIGSRYFTVKQSYELYAGFRTLVQNDLDHDNAWGDAQTAVNTISLASAFVDKVTWNVLGSSVAFTSLILDASEGGTLDSQLTGAGVSDSSFPRTEYYMNVDHWDGFPNRRKVLMENIDKTSSPTDDTLPISLKDANTIILSGDIHAAYATDHGQAIDGDGVGNISNTFAALQGQGRAVEFTVPGISSGSFARFVGDAGQGILGTTEDSEPATKAKNQIVAYTLAKQLDGMLTSATSSLGTAPTWADSTKNGIAIIEATPTKLTTTYHMLNDILGISNFTPAELPADYDTLSEEDQATARETASNATAVSFATTVGAAGTGQGASGLFDINSTAFDGDAVLTWTTKVFEVANNVGVQTAGFNLNGPLEDVTPT